MQQLTSRRFTPAAAALCAASLATTSHAALITMDMISGGAAGGELGTNSYGTWTDYVLPGTDDQVVVEVKPTNVYGSQRATSSSFGIYSNEWSKSSSTIDHEWDPEFHNGQPTRQESRNEVLTMRVTVPAPYTVKLHSVTIGNFVSGGTVGATTATITLDSLGLSHDITVADVASLFSDSWVLNTGSEVDFTVGTSGVDAFGDRSAYGIKAITFEVIPEPASLALLGLGGALMLGRSRQA